MGLVEVGQRLREERQRLGLDQRKMAIAGGVSRNSQLAYEAGHTPPNAEYLLELEKGGADAAYILTGRRSGGTLVTANNADWVDVHEYDLRSFTDGGKGESVASTLFRRDWLYRAIGRTGPNGSIWLCRAMQDYQSAGIERGETIFCQDISTADLDEGGLCLWRVASGGVIMGRFSFLAMASGAIGHLPGAQASQGALAPTDRIVTPTEIGGDGCLLIARVLGTLLRPV